MRIERAVDLFLDSVRVSDGSAATAESYRYHLKSFVSFLEENQIGGDRLLDPSTIESFLLFESARGLSPYTVYGRFAVLRNWFNWMASRSEFDFDKSPTDQIKRKKPKVPPRVADFGEVQKLLNHIRGVHPTSWVELRDGVIVQVMLYCGLRIGEVAGLRLGDFSPADRTLFVRKAKGNKERIVPVTQDVSMRLVEYLFNRPHSDHFWLSAGTGRHKGNALRGPGMRTMMGRRCDEAGVKSMNPHSLRHLFAIRSLNNGMRVAALSQIMGHSSVLVTMDYYARWIPSGLVHEYDLANRDVM